MSRDFIRGLVRARLELIFRLALEERRYEVAIEATKAQCRLFGLKIDGPGSAPTISLETWDKLFADAKKRRDS